MDARTRTKLIEKVRDDPAWVEMRCSLLSGGEVFGDAGAAAVASPERDLICIAGQPARQTLAEAVRSCTPGVEVLCQEADAEHVAAMLGSRGAAAVIHAPGDSGWTVPPLERAHQVRELTRDDLGPIAAVDEDLMSELDSALEKTSVTAVVVEGRAVAFCYPGSITERWWDVSIDTLEPFRRQGFAGAAFGALAERMRSRGKSPVWGAYVSNEASWRLARKLGFRPVARVFVWQASAGGYRPGDEG